MSSIYLIDYYANRKEGFFQKSSVYFKLGFFLFFILSIVFSKSLSFLFLVLFFIYCLSFLIKLPVLKMFKWALYPTFFSLIFALSQWGVGNLPYQTVLRAFSSASVALFFSLITPSHQTFGVICKISPFLGTILFLTYRYLFVLVDKIENKLIFLKKRGGNKKKIKTISFLIGFFIVDLINRSERIYQILKIRGFRGVIHSEVNFFLNFSGLLIFVFGLFFFLLNFYI